MVVDTKRRMRRRVSPGLGVDSDLELYHRFRFRQFGLLSASTKSPLVDQSKVEHTQIETDRSGSSVNRTQILLKTKRSPELIFVGFLSETTGPPVESSLCFYPASELFSPDKPVVAGLVPDSHIDLPERRFNFSVSSFVVVFFFFFFLVVS